MSTVTARAELAAWRDLAEIDHTTPRWRDISAFVSAPNNIIPTARIYILKMTDPALIRVHLLMRYDRHLSPRILIVSSSTNADIQRVTLRESNAPAVTNVVVTRDLSIPAADYMTDSTIRLTSSGGGIQILKIGRVEQYY